MADSQPSPPVEAPPYPIPVALLGGVPTPSVDDPISAVFLFLFISLAVVHMTIFQLNRKKSHKFVFSGLLFGLSMARSIAMIMRIVWASNSTNVRIALAANIFSQAGVIIIFIANLFFAQRLFRAYLPSAGWHKATGLALKFLVGCVIACLVMVIVTVVHSSYSLDRAAQDKDRKVQLFAGTFFAILAFVPVPVILSAVLISRHKRSNSQAVSDDTSSSSPDDKQPRQAQLMGSRASGRPEKFGTGRLRTKVRLILFTSVILTLGAAFRVATNFAARPANDPAWYHSRACYYCFNFVIEIICSALYAAVRFDRRFHVPNGAKGPGDYSAGRQSATSGLGGKIEEGSAHAAVAEEEAEGLHGVGPHFTRNVNTEEETFGPDGEESEEGTLGRAKEEV
ncbi:hypothetical protein Micbo1qcDRAFT_168013 [Microdochium bolleyi]|uniref:Uncharacterized protein n=1 Tax=Microdochium bolleyi TaxID=196109 RepID=A0A136IPS2_9PEZI|nr:hypothetical protein Micbo1qcDRAFT_168013 [Microdochium bolleyi]